KGLVDSVVHREEDKVTKVAGRLLQNRKPASNGSKPGLMGLLSTLEEGAVLAPAVSNYGAESQRRIDGFRQRAGLETTSSADPHNDSCVGKAFHGMNVRVMDLMNQHLSRPTSITVASSGLPAREWSELHMNLVIEALS